MWHGYWLVTMLAFVTSPNLSPTHPQSSSGDQGELAPRTIGILGSGIMGAGIAEVFASAGHSVVLRSRTAESASDALRTLAANLEKQVQRGRLEAQRKIDILALCTTTTQLEDLKDCDVVIESVVEDIETKIALFAELDLLLPPTTILASNTSTLPIIECRWWKLFDPLLRQTKLFNLPWHSLSPVGKHRFMCATMRGSL
jgi:3-hydroxyisobutyrate dehydrogenase-like beta-hydroxyacid dehydrogenase